MGCVARWWRSLSGALEPGAGQLPGATPLRAAGAYTGPLDICRQSPNSEDDIILKLSNILQRISPTLTTYKRPGLDQDIGRLYRMTILYLPTLIWY